MRQRSTLSHELAHVLFEDGENDASANWRERRPREIRADAFARHLLVPADGLREVLGERRALQEVDLSMVVQRFRVSPGVAAIALHQAGYINETSKTTWMTSTTPSLAARHGWSDQYQALRADSDRRRAPQKLLARAIRGYKEGVVSVQTIATLRRLRAEQIEAEFQAAGITPIDQPIAWTDATDLPAKDVDFSDLDDDQGLGTSR